ncbi:MAG: hypothetical protein NTY38_03360 [Acidobacteria bacterium]|nr:hypothetical protein [Acidobacteriota bacterium]
MNEPKLDSEAIKELEESKNEILRRVAEKLRGQVEDGLCAGHSSHSSGTAGKTHSSTTSGH